MSRGPVLHRDDPNKEPLVGHVKVTRGDWLNVARDILVSDGVAEVKVLAIGERLGVSRSSVYWYFKSRKDLLDALLEDWEGRNTAVILTHCGMATDTIPAAGGNFFRCFLDPALFERPGYGADEAALRARILNVMQRRYHALDQTEPLRDRLTRTEGYLLCLTGRAPGPHESEALADFARKKT